MDQCFNPLTGISSILTESVLGATASRGGKFQSPDGDFVYSDKGPAAPPFLRGRGGFNPLTGISSILTCWNGRRTGLLVWRFQSPDGDFVYSDNRLLKL